MAAALLREGEVLLYGTLTVRIHSASNLPNMDPIFDWLDRLFRPVQCVVNGCQSAASKLKEPIDRVGIKITSDPYVAIGLGEATLARTKVLRNSEDPVWDENFRLHVAHVASELVFTVKDADPLGAEVIGYVRLPAADVANGIYEQVDEYDVVTAEKKTVRRGSKLRLQVRYQAMEGDPRFSNGVLGGVPETYFSMRTGGRVSLYQDAHCDKSLLPDIQLEGGKLYEHRSCWEDICDAIYEAQKLVYIAGWSVYHKVKLVRNAGTMDMSEANLGELLKMKAREGVRVLLLVWDDRSSHRLFKQEGVMGTHDEETRKFFKHSSVKCILSPRYADSTLSWLRQRVVGTIYSHHQKVVIVDSQAEKNKRNISAFLGGLDLTSGRFDTQQHSLFRTLETIHKDDYYNASFSRSGGPRQPWHDMHCKIDGPAAYDVLANFEQRWKSAARWHHEDLVEIDRISFVNTPSKGEKTVKVTSDDDPETWDVQVFRSIDSGSVRGFPKTTEEAERQHLVTGKDVVVENSIHTAYVERIRSAQRFIYIENQYFIGSSYAWSSSYRSGKATNLVPMELALKIVSKIKRRERFAVYVVIPLWPEGNPQAAIMQEMLFFQVELTVGACEMLSCFSLLQSRTMEMMYKIVAAALKEAGSESHPKEYLNFYCLGNRESHPVPVTAAESSPQWHAQKNKRFMIYVHSKGMVVDDEFVIIGSANVNQRSMSGTRDTEIAMGAYQPHHTWTEKGAPPRSQVYGYRASLWSEHLGRYEDIFADPSDLQCVKRVNELADENQSRSRTKVLLALSSNLFQTSPGASSVALRLMCRTLTENARLVSKTSAPLHLVSAQT